MSAEAGTAGSPLASAARLPLDRLRDAVLWLAVFLGGFVIFEPAPYELFLVAVIPIAFIAGLPIPRSVGPLLCAFIVYIVGGLLATTQTGAPRFVDALVYMGVSLFLAISSVWYAALVADDWRLVRLIERAYVATAVIVALTGILGYFRLLPGADNFLLYGRAKGTFQDPNVFGPFLLMPTLFLARRLMVGPILAQPGTVLGLMVLVLAVFLSFSRAAWGMLAVALPLLAAVVSANFGTNRARLRLLGIVVVGVAALVVLLAVAASIPAVQELLVQRAKLVQDYDGKTGAELGRFARHWAGFALALERPLGIGPWEFDRLYIEATHNTYLKALMEYGWLGFVSYLILVIWTARRAFALMFSPRPWQGFAQCVVITFYLHMAVGWIIDTDHWRHFYMSIGLIWGLAAADAAWRRERPGQVGANPASIPA
jgi:O-antigen ligase